MRVVCSQRLTAWPRKLYGWSYARCSYSHTTPCQHVATRKAEFSGSDPSLKGEFVLLSLEQSLFLYRCTAQALSNRSDSRKTRMMLFSFLSSDDPEDRITASTAVMNDLRILNKY